MIIASSNFHFDTKVKELGQVAITANKYYKCVTPFAIFITLAQIMQMIVGMYVTVKAVFFSQTRTT